jgi:hypothetical protein
VLLTHLNAKPILINRIKEEQGRHTSSIKIIGEVKKENQIAYSVRENVILMYNNKLCVIEMDELKKETLEEAYSSFYIMHLIVRKCLKY